MYATNNASYRVFVPTDAATARFDPRSAIVAPDNEISAEGFVVWLESNRYDVENLRRYVERVHHAAGRADQRYPTIAKCYVSGSDLIQVARYDLTDALLTPTNLQALKRWLDPEPVERCFDLHALEWAEVMRAQGRVNIGNRVAPQVPPLVLARARAYLAMFAEGAAPAVATGPFPPC